MEKKGMVYLVGAGPGDPELITLKGKRILSLAEVLVYDRLVSRELLFMAPGDCERIYVGKAPGLHSVRQEEINRILVKKAMEGKTVVRLKGGDPFVFGRGGEEIMELERHGIFYEVIPGVTSAIAAPAHVGIPVTHRDLSRSLHVITGHRQGDSTGFWDGDFEEAFRQYAKLDGTLVFLMGLSNLERIAEALMKYGKSLDTPAAVVTNGTMVNEQCVRAKLADLSEAVRERGLSSPGIILVGPTADFHFTAAGKGPLAGAAVGVTGTAPMYEKMAAKLSGLGAAVRKIGDLKILEEPKEVLAGELDRLSEYRWIVFTSRNGAELFFDALKERETDIRVLGNIRFAVIGRGTGDYLKTRGIRADLMPEVYTAEALGQLLAENAAVKERILIPRAKQGSKRLTEILEEAGLAYRDLPIYDLALESRKPSQTDGLDYVTFESASGVRAFFQGGQLLSPKTTAAAIGDVTGRELKKYGVSRFLTAETYTAEGLVEAIAKDWERRKKRG